MTEIEEAVKWLEQKRKDSAGQINRITNIDTCLAALREKSRAGQRWRTSNETDTRCNLR